MAFDRDKFKALVHYIIARAGKSDGFGAVKLYKILWFSEARQFVLTGRPITGASYIRMPYGPMPRIGKTIRDELAHEGAIRQWRDRRYDYEGWRMVSQREPKMVGFTEDELTTIHYWIEHIDKDHTATSISEESHDYAWDIAGDREEIPFYAHLATRIRRPNKEELERAKAAAKRLSLP